MHLLIPPSRPASGHHGRRQGSRGKKPPLQKRVEEKTRSSAPTSALHSPPPRNSPPACNEITQVEPQYHHTPDPSHRPNATIAVRPRPPCNSAPWGLPNSFKKQPRNICPVMGSLEPRALHASRLLESAHARPKEIHPPKGRPLSRHGSLEPSSSAACLLLESMPTGRFFVWPWFSQTFTAERYRLIFLDPRAPPTSIIGKETVPSRDLWNLKLHLRVCSSRARGSNTLALKAQSWLAPQAHLGALALP